MKIDYATIYGMKWRKKFLIKGKETRMKRILALVLLAAFAVGGASCHKQDKGTKPAVKTEKKVKAPKAPKTHKAKKVVADKKVATKVEQKA